MISISFSIKRCLSFEEKLYYSGAGLFFGAQPGVPKSLRYYNATDLGEAYFTIIADHSVAHRHFTFVFLYSIVSLKLVVKHGVANII